MYSFQDTVNNVGLLLTTRDSSSTTGEYFV